MARIVPAKCPNCGAALRLDADQEVITCTYCGTSALIQRDDRPPPPEPPTGHVIRVPAAAQRNTGAQVAMLLGLFIFVGIVVGVIGLSSALRPVRRPGPSLPPVTDPKTTDHAAFGGRRPFLVDLNADGTSDLLTAVSVYGAGTPRYGFAAFDGKAGTLLWQTNDLESDALRAPIGLWFDHLLVGLDSGEVRGYDARSGARKFALKLPERVDHFCDALWAAAVRALLKDGKAVDIDLASGKLRAPPKDAACHPVPSGATAKSDVGKHFFPDEDLPSEIESYHCGSITVQGTYNYFFPDQCPKKLGLGAKALGDLEPGAIAKLGTSWLILGKRQPGSAVPMLGVARGGKLAWSAVIPSKDPLSVTTGTPGLVGIGRQRVVVAYEPAGATAPNIAAFELDSGKRLYDEPVALSGARGLVSSDDRVAVFTSSEIVLLAADSGKQVFSLGR